MFITFVLKNIEMYVKQMTNLKEKNTYKVVDR